MRICSLVPSATEIVAALGLEGDLVGRSAECTYPPSVAVLPVVSTSRIDTERLRSAEIDRSISAALASGRPLYALDAELLDALDPDLILTQDLCDVCAVSRGEIERLSATRARTIALDPRTLDEVVDSIRAVGDAVGAQDRARRVADDLHDAIEEVRCLVEGLDRPRVFVAEWLDPPFAAGHWVPEMVAAAGGREILGRAGQRSFRTSWEEVAAGRPGLVVLACCGYDVERTVAESRSVPALGVRTVAVDGDSHYSRPGPRLADGVRQLGYLLHPDRVPASDLPARTLRG